MLLAEPIKPAPRPLAYSVEMVDPPCLQPRTTKGETGATARFAEADSLLIGEHYASNEDHLLEANLIGRMLKNRAKQNRAISIGLEMVQQSCQVQPQIPYHNIVINLIQKLIVFNNCLCILDGTG